MYRTTILAYFLGFLLCSTPIADLYAQALSIRNYGLIEGLPEASIKSIVEDKKGFLWFATLGGVSRFDGRVFENFTTEHGLLNNNINTIFQSSKGIIWVGTRNGLAYFHNNAFKVLTTKEGLPSSDISAIVEDSKGNLWIGTAGGLSMYDGKKFKNFVSKEVFPDNYIVDLSIAKSGKIWIVTLEGLCLWDGSGFKVYKKEDGLPTTNINYVYADAEETVWLATSLGLVEFKQGKFKTFGKAAGLTDNNAWFVLEENQDQFWVATSDGAALFDKTKQDYVQFINKRNGLAAQQVNTMLKDQFGNLWLGCEGGLARYNMPIFEIFSSGYIPNNASIWSAFSDSDGSTWLGTAGEGLVQIRKEATKVYTTAQGLADEYVRSIFKDQDGYLWFGTFEGVSRFKGGAFKNFDEEDGLANNAVFAITQDDEGNIWFGTDKGLSKYDGKSFENFTVKEGIADNYVRAALKDKNGVLWFGTYGGITKYEKGKFSNFSAQNGLANNIVLSILQDSKGQLWFATENGLCQMKPDANPSKRDCFTCYGRAEGMQSQNVWLLIEGQEGDIWIGHRTGIERFNPAKKQFQSYNHLDGFNLMQTFPNAVSKDAEGNIWFGALNGAIKYNKAQDVPTKIAPKIHITRIDIVGQNADWSKLAKQTDSYFKIPTSPDAKKPAVYLDYKQNNLTFHFTGIHSKTPEKVYYKYKLEGFDKNWSNNTRQGSVNYTNLPPGRYKFLVAAYSPDGLVSQEYATFVFEINPPYWETWWFYLLQLALFLTLVSVSIYYNVHLHHRRSKVTVILTFITLLMVFEFIAVNLDNIIDSYTQNIPFYKTLVNVVLAILFSPLEGFVRKYYEETHD
ncbi:MAG TPA: hypothetical protein DCM08_12740 [Microscillaceae bacterium]|nr:hypothetical protein [Microscillaceae bacterium]